MTGGAAILEIIDQRARYGVWRWDDLAGGEREVER